MLRFAALALAFLAAGPALADPAADAATSYRLDTAASTTELRTGDAGKFVVTIVPEEKIHVHPQAPLRIVVESAGLSLARRSLGHKDAVDPTAGALRFEVPFTAPKAGRYAVQAKLDFFICSDAWCVKQTRDVTVAVTVK
jgi:hypothetical protein